MANCLVRRALKVQVILRAVAPGLPLKKTQIPEQLKHLAQPLNLGFASKVVLYWYIMVVVGKHFASLLIVV